MINKKRKRFNKYFILSFFLIAFFAVPFIVFSATSGTNNFESVKFTPQIEFPGTGISGETDLSNLPNDDGIITSDLLSKYIKAIYQYGLSVAGILAAVIIMGAGVIWLTSAGDSGKINKAKQYIFGSLIGVFLLFGAYIILNTINPNLIELKPIEISELAKIEQNEVICCDPIKGPITIKVKEIEDKMYYADSTLEIGGIRKEAGDLFNGCYKDLMLPGCDIENGDICDRVQRMGWEEMLDNDQYFCLSNESDICCTCIIGNNLALNKYMSCHRNVTKSECDRICNNELNNANIKDNKTYTLSSQWKYRPSTFGCKDLRARDASYCADIYSGAGGTW